MNIPSIPEDKANHATYCAAIAAVVASVTIASDHAPLAPIIADITVAIVAVGKELLDAWGNYRTTGNWRKGPHGVEVNDLLAGLIGGWLVTMPIRMLQ